MFQCESTQTKPAHPPNRYRRHKRRGSWQEPETSHSSPCSAHPLGRLVLPCRSCQMPTHAAPEHGTFNFPAVRQSTLWAWAYPNQTHKGRRGGAPPANHGCNYWVFPPDSKRTIKGGRKQRSRRFIAGKRWLSDSAKRWGHARLAPVKKSACSHARAVCSQKGKASKSGAIKTR